MAEGIVGTPSPEEELLIAMRDGAYDVAAETMLADLARGEAPRMLAVVRPDILVGVANQLWSSVEGQPVAGTGYKADMFQAYLGAAAEGNPAAISMLPKLATSLGEVAMAIELTMDNLSAVTEWRSGRPCVQYIGSFNPMHIGHRATIARTLEAAGPNSSVLVQAVAAHPKKTDLPPYSDRFLPGERKLLHSAIVDPTRATFIDVPLSLGLAKVGTEQIRLIADVTGDDKMRWQLGSDKFITDVRTVQAGKQLDKAGARFRNVHLYVARRDTETAEEINDGIGYLQENFGTGVTILAEASDPLITEAAASKIRAMRAEGRHWEADEMEYRDIEIAKISDEFRRSGSNYENRPHQQR
ncbi:MAG TPA: hypothetical protein VKQ34_03180 [Candidatus Saccharimonadales bacterium]|nr:hypothetical protein [Candidatus Saccharimonadales bacterium]